MKRNCWQILELIQRRWYAKLYVPRGSVYIMWLLTPNSVFSHISVAVVRKNWRDGIQQLQEATNTLQYLHRQGHRPLAISRILQDEGMTASKRGIAKFLKRYRETGTIARLPGSGRPSKITAEIKQIVDEQMRADDETTAYQLYASVATT